MHGRDGLCTDWKKSRDRQNPDSGRKGKVEARDVEQNIVEREIYRRRFSNKKLIR